MASKVDEQLWNPRCEILIIHDCVEPRSYASLRSLLRTSLWRWLAVIWLVFILGQWKSSNFSTGKSTFYVIDRRSMKEKKPTTFYNSEGQWKPLPRAYDILHGLLPVSFPCRNPTRLYAGVCTASDFFRRKNKARLGQKEEREPLPRSYTVLCRFINSNLSVRLKKYTVFIRFSLFFALKTVGFSAFFPRFSFYGVKTR